MSDGYQELPEKLREILKREIWESWSTKQRAYILAQEGQLVEDISFGKRGLPRKYGEYKGKKWELGHSRPMLQESCPKCKFDYCFYARPRNWSSMGGGLFETVDTVQFMELSFLYLVDLYR